MNASSETTMSPETRAAIERHLPEAREIFLQVYGENSRLIGGGSMASDAAAWECVWAAMCKVEPLLPHMVFDSTLIEAATAWILSKAEAQAQSLVEPKSKTEDGLSNLNIQLAIARAQLCQSRAAQSQASAISGSYKSLLGKVKRLGGEDLTEQELLDREMRTADRHISMAQSHLDKASAAWTSHLHNSVSR